MNERTFSAPARASKSEKLGYGLLAVLPLLLLLASGAAGVSASLSGSDLATAAELVYVHIAVQFIALLIYGDLLMKSRTIDGTGRALWGAYFLLLAPAAMISFWFVHVWQAGQVSAPRRVRALPVG